MSITERNVDPLFATKSRPLSLRTHHITSRSLMNFAVALKNVPDLTLAFDAWDHSDFLLRPVS